MPFDLDFVTPELAVGGSFPRGAEPDLAASLGIKRVIDLRLEDSDDPDALASAGIQLLRLPALDGSAPDGQQLDEGVAWACAGLDRKERVLIHCQHGIGRSPLLTFCVLVARGLSPVEAVETVKRGRPAIMPNWEQLAALVRWAGSFARGHAVGWQLPTVEELQAVAWRNLWRGP
jgi:protein-tyrosine phosphatase